MLPAGGLERAYLVANYCPSEMEPRASQLCTRVDACVCKVQPLALLPFAALITFVPSFRTGSVTAQVAWNCFFQLNVRSLFPLWARRFTSKGERWRSSGRLGVPRSTGADSLVRMLHCSLEIGGKVHLLERNLADSTHRNASKSSTL